MSRLVATASLVLVLISTSSCSLLWLFNSDPAGLPCDFTSSQNGESGVCLDGYVCVEQAESEFICLVQGNLQKGEPCVQSEQCDESLTCATAYADCLVDGDDPICSMIPDAEKQLACRETCDIGNPTTCADNERCFDFEPDFCQLGVCSADSDCELVAGSNALCAGEQLNEGTSGLCFQFCDPLVCDDDVCSDCTGVNGQVNTDESCVPVFDEVVSTRNVCGTIGTQEFFADCGGGEGCVAGSFCGTVDGVTSICVPWCRFNSKNSPQCPSDSQCGGVGGDLGICLPNQYPGRNGSVTRAGKAATGRVKEGTRRRPPESSLLPP